MKFYVTTPLYYVNAAPHIGHAYTCLAADVLARYHRMAKADVFFLTGTDEHGQKIADAAEKRGLPVQEHVDGMVQVYKDMWTLLGITYNRFIRTTEPAHEAVVRSVFSRLLDSGDLYAGDYRGYYCVHCESYIVPDKEACCAVCPDCGRQAREITEPSYFFRLSKYRDRIRNHILQNPGFIRPDFRRNEVLSFLENQLHDLSITRRNVTWGIASPTPEGYPIYVWFDALLNYISAVGYGTDESEFRRWWPPDVQLMAKDIIRFHLVVWPAILMALDLPLPSAVFAHGWWTMKREKISKSVGNVVDPRQVAADYGVDPFRYFVLREVPFGLDGEYSEPAFRKRYNSDLANDLGNLVNRTLHLVRTRCEGRIPAGQRDQHLASLVETAFASYRGHFSDMTFSLAIEDAWTLVTALNRYLDTQAPWRLESADAGPCLYRVLEGIRAAALLMAPFIPGTSAEIWRMLGIPEDPGTAGFRAMDRCLQPGGSIGEPKILFPRRK